MSRPGMALIGATLVLLVGGIGYAGWQLSHAPPPLETKETSAAAFCRPCADLARLEGVMTASLSRAGGGGIDAADRLRILTGIKGWHRRCSTLLCEMKTGTAQACSAPPAALLSQLAAIDQVTDGLTSQTAKCSAGGCQSTRCEPARSAANAFGTLQEELRGLIDHPSALAGERRDVATGFMFDEIGTLTATVLSAPDLAAQGRYAAAQARLLFLRDAALTAGANVPDSAEGQLADRLEDLARSIDAMAKGERVGLTGAALASLWQDFSESSARILVETASLQTRMPTRTNAFAQLLAPQAGASEAAVAGPVCNGAVRLVQATETRLSQAMSQLSMCNIRADCHLENDATSSIVPHDAGGRNVLDALSTENAAALAALQSLAYEKDEDVGLKTDLAQYWSREAIAVTPLGDSNRCLADKGSRLVLSSDRADGAVVPVESHPLDPSDTAAWLFEAPRTPGRYRFMLLAAKARGEGVFGMSEPFEVGAAPAGCNGFSGTWQTDFGVLTVNVRGGVARGTYRQSDDDRAGVLEGNIDGPILIGRWYSEIGSGGTRLTLSDDGQSFAGTWSQLIERTGGAGKWEGHCIAGASGALTPSGSTATVQTPAPAGQPVH